MRSPGAVLELIAAEPGLTSGLATAPLSLRVSAGECVVIEADDAEQLEAFADLCSGIAPLYAGEVRYLGHDWTDLPHDHAAALRGRIGRVFANGGWLPFLDAETNILLSQLHHTQESLSELRAAAAMLAQEFGLPGLPQGRFVDLSPADRGCAMLIRAFLGEPRLLLLSHAAVDPRVSILTRISAAHDCGAATIWLAQARATLDIREFGAKRWLRLGADGLTMPRFTA
jgi:phospholipid/cholesterol/gamma-HCH transport system ATP-binding protein